MAEPQESKKRTGKIAVQSKTGQPRYQGTYVIPADEPLVLDLSQVEEIDLAEMMADVHLFKLRTDTPLTPTAAIVRFKPNR